MDREDILSTYEAKPGLAVTSGNGLVIACDLHIIDALKFSLMIRR